MIEDKFKPKVELKNVDVVVNTQNVKELNILMNILEIEGSLNWPLKQSPIEGAVPEKRISQYGANTCINLNGGEYLSWGEKDVYKKEYVLSLQQFCERNEITLEKLNEINNYFNFKG